MLIPRTVAKIITHTDSSSLRYSLGGVLFERDSSGVSHAIATDGRRLMHVSWDEPTDLDSCAVAPTCELSPVVGFSKIIDAAHLKSAAGLAKTAGVKRTEKQNELAVDYIALDEPNANGVATFHGANTTSAASVTEPTLAGRFPAWRNVIPEIDSDTITVSIDWRFMKQAFEAIGAVSRNDDNAFVEIHIRDATTPVLITAEGVDAFGCKTKAECVIMPSRETK